MPVSIPKLRRLFEAATRDRTPDRFFDDLRTGLREKSIRPTDFSIRQLFENFITDSSGNICGREIVADWNPGRGGSSESESFVRLVESGAVNTAAFSNISGQIVYSTVMEAYEQEAFVFSGVIPVQQTEFNGEKIPGIGRIGDKAEVVDENGAYPRVGVNEDWVETPVTTKRGLILPLTKEAMFFDRTGLLLSRCSEVGDALGLNKEKRAIDCVIDENTTKHRYNRKSRGAVATYGNNSGNHDWDNLEASNALVDWTDIDNAMQLFNGIVDPNTGEPVVINNPLRLICVKALESTALRIRNATEVTTVTPGYATSANPIETRGPNPVGGAYEILTSRQLAARLATDTSWFLGDPTKAFRYMQNWPMAVVQAPVNSQREFDYDVVMEWKASERGQFATVEPRYMVACTA